MKTANRWELEKAAKKLSVTDEWEGIQLLVPLEPLADMLEVVD